MKIISAIILALVTVACAPSPSTTNDTYTRICKDKDGKVVANSNCESLATSNANSGMSPFMWWYIGTQMGNSYPVGSYVSPGIGRATAPVSAFSSTSNISRPSTAVSKPSTSFRSTPSVSRPTSTYRPSTGSSFRSSGSSFRSSGGSFRGR